jgi:hypothetical protein
MTSLRVMIACEESGTIVKHFRKFKNVEAYSCDILPTSGSNPQWHIQDDVLNHLNNGWDLIIAHPPCTYLSNSGVRWLKSVPGRYDLMVKAANFFKTILDCDCNHIAVENPIIHKYAVEIIGRRQDQIIHPWQFGHGETKATCLWLKNLPKLKPTNIVSGREPRILNLSPSKDRAKIRSKTFEGIGEAIATQYHNYLRGKNAS